MQNLLEMGEEIMDEVGMTSLSALTSSSEEEATQLITFLQATAKEMIKAFDWQALQNEGTFTTTDEQLQVHIPTAFPHLARFVPETMFNRDRGCRIRGPLSPKHWQRMQASSPVLDGRFFRIRQNNLYFLGNATEDQNIYFEWISQQWVTNEAGDEFRKKFEADTDLPLIDDRGLVLGAKWRMLRQMGQEFNSARDEYQKYLSALRGTDLPRETLNINRHRYGDFSIPDIRGDLEFEDVLVWSDD